MHVLGIDFGTSNTVGMLRYPDGQVRPLLFDGSPLLPSAVYLTAAGEMLVGRDAERQARPDPRRFEPHPKSRIDDGDILLGDRELRVETVIGAVLAHVAREARRMLGADPDEVRLTHPVRWGERRRAVLREAARAAVVRRIPTGFEVLAEDGVPDVGGVDLDGTRGPGPALSGPHRAGPSTDDHRRTRRAAGDLPRRRSVAHPAGRAPDPRRTSRAADRSSGWTAATSSPRC